ncbi:hypothetical protein PInf_008475 [Phytophthora infestans]|nr:hypothetical protein PInf_008475 [Phytophthora infestans]
MYIQPAFEAKKEVEKKDEEDVAVDGWEVDGEKPEDEVDAPSSRIVKTGGIVTINTRCKMKTLFAKAVQSKTDEDRTVSRFNEVAKYR